MVAAAVPAAVLAVRWEAAEAVVLLAVGAASQGLVEAIGAAVARPGARGAAAATGASVAITVEAARPVVAIVSCTPCNCRRCQWRSRHAC